MGQPLDDAVPGHQPRAGGGPPGDRAGDERSWIEDEFIPTVAKRGAAIIEARGASSAKSAASAAIDHVHDWVLGTPEGDWVSMGIPSDGSYGIDEGIICGFPCTCSGGEWQIVQGLEIDDFSRERIDASVDELKSERDAVQGLDLDLVAPGLASRCRYVAVYLRPDFLTLPSFWRSPRTRYM